MKLPFWAIARLLARPKGRWVVVRLRPRLVEARQPLPWIRQIIEAESLRRTSSLAAFRRMADYVISDLQPTYFVIESFEDLFRQTVERDFDRLYRSLGPSFTYANTAVIDVDNVLHRGTQEYLLRGGRGSGAQPI